MTKLRLWLYCTLTWLANWVRPDMHLRIMSRVKPPSGLPLEGAIEAGEFVEMDVEWPIATPLGAILTDQKGDLWVCCGRPEEEPDE